MKRITPLVLAALLSAAAVACGDDKASTTDTKPSKLTLVAYTAFVQPKALADFTAATGIAVDVVDGGDTGVMVSKAVLTAGKPEGDVMWGVDDPSVQRVLDAKVFDAHAVADASALDPALSTYEPRLTPVDIGDVCLNVDPAWFTAHQLTPPTGLDDLADPKYRDLLVVENPATSSPGLAFLLSTIAAKGNDGYLAYWKSLRANGVKVVDDWNTAYDTEFTQGANHGGHPIVVSYASSPPATIVFADDPKPTEPTTAVVESTCYRVAEYAGVLRGTSHPTAAGQLVDFLVSKSLQEQLPLSNFVYPSRTDAALPDLFTKFAPKPAKPARLDPADVAAHRQRWTDDWTTAVLR